ncbi:MAG: IPT/TIG domain-containing protein [Candidatus Thiodiazotropha sp.]
MITINCIETSQIVISGSADPSDPSSCQSVTSAKSGCMDALPSGGNSSKFNFAFWTCATPVVNMVDQRNGTAKTVITVSGEGFSTTDCQNEILFSDYACDVTSSSEESVTCTMDKMTEPELGVYHPISMRVGNRGNAVIKIMSPEDRSFGLLPNVEDITPNVGSLAGGARLTITGFGFGDSLSVLVGGYSCSVVESSYTEILCETPASVSSAQVDVEVSVMVNGVPQMAACETGNQECKYTYSSSMTPTMSAVNPSSMSGATTFTITGTNFGTDTSALEINIGSVSATVMSSDGTSLVATIQNVPAGSDTVVVKHAEYGKADGSVLVTGTPVISSILPNTGSIHGETEITIRGNGFVDGDTTVTIDSSPCTVISMSLSHVICVTPAHATGTVILDVTSNSVSYTSESFTYATGFTPTVTSISPTSGLPGDTLTISGSNLNGSNVVVELDSVPCNITSGSSSQIQCTVGAHATGLVPVYVHVEGLGASNIDVEFEYSLQLSGINPVTGNFRAIDEQII